MYEGLWQHTDHLNLLFGVEGRFYRRSAAALLPIEEMVRYGFVGFC